MDMALSLINLHNSAKVASDGDGEGEALATCRRLQLGIRLQPVTCCYISFRLRLFTMGHTRIRQEATITPTRTPYRTFLHGNIVRRQKSLKNFVPASQNKRHKLPLPIELNCHVDNLARSPATTCSSQSSNIFSSQGGIQRRILRIRKHPAYLTVRSSVAKRNEAGDLIASLIDSANDAYISDLITRLAERNDICINVTRYIINGFTAHMPNYMVDECGELVRQSQSQARSQRSSIFEFLQLNSNINYTNCPGCGESFIGTASSTKYKEKEYFRHCILGCVKYEKLALLRLCTLCKLIFVNDDYYVDHLTSKHSRKGDLHE